MGYTPAFDTLYTGTLYGKWPAAAVWASLLPLVNKHGVIDFSYEAISGMTGWPMKLLKQGIEALCEPDESSRSEAEQGKRLVLVDPARPWGWKVVNHSLYRERARKQMHNQLAVQSGDNAKRLKTRRDQTRPDANGCDRPSDSDANTDTNKEQEGAPAPLGLDLKAWEEWFSYRKQTGKPIRPASVRRAQEELARHGSQQGDVVAYSIAQSYQGLFTPKTSGAPKSKARLEQLYPGHEF